MGVEGGISINFSMATDAVITGIDILLTSDSITLVYRSRVSSPQNSNIMPLNQALVLQRAFFRASQRCTLSFLELARSRLTEGTSQLRQNSSALTGSKLEAKMLTACTIAWEVHCSGRVIAITSFQCSRLGMILKALGTLPLRQRLNILPISLQTFLTSGLSSDFSSTSLSFFYRSASQSLVELVPVSPRMLSKSISASEA